MGWLFGRKRSVPFPEPRKIDERAFQFPTKVSSERVIRPEQFKEASGFNEPLDFSDDHEPPTPLPPKPSAMGMPFPLTAPKTAAMPLNPTKSPFFIKVQVYQHILGEIESVRNDLNQLQNHNRTLENSEYNEETNFGKLRRTMKSIHDDLVEADNHLFKNPIR
ncbi:TPA: hypothetical protein HA241_06335 [Candidatus Woesearchaeota archaeon]|nr:hypothetical protein [Candidatus Woesearchaeota archaeon]